MHVTTFITHQLVVFPYSLNPHVTYIHKASVHIAKNHERRFSFSLLFLITFIEREYAGDIGIIYFLENLYLRFKLTNRIRNGNKILEK
jgi:hypothetical protein